jgi:hypothetical protein
VDRRYLVPGGANASNTGCVSPRSSDSPSFGRALRDRPIRQAPGCACPTFRRSCLASAQNSSRVSLAASSPRPRPPSSVITTCTCSCNTATLGQTVIQYRRLNVATVPNAESSTNENKTPLLPSALSSLQSPRSSAHHPPHPNIAQITPSTARHMKSDLSKTTFGEANECEICRGATSYSKSAAAPPDPCGCGKVMAACPCRP